MTTLINTEIERKFLIKKPDIDALRLFPGFGISKIVQTYLINQDGFVERARMRAYPDKTVYYHTLKKRLSSASAYENESEVSREEYEQLLKRANPEKTPIEKMRCTLPHEGHVCEIDIYPFWQKQAVLEIELSSEDEKYSIPDCISVIREVTGNHAYSNNALSSSIPAED